MSEIKDDDLRQCVSLYLDYYERKLPEEEKELTERISAKRLDDYKSRQRAENEKVEALMRRAGI